MKKISLFLIVLVTLVFGTNIVSAQSIPNLDFGNLGSDLTPDVSNITGGNSDVNDAISNANTIKEELTGPSKVDANGNLTIKPAEVYNSSVNIKGSLTTGPASSIIGDVVASGNVILGESANVKGNVTVTGNLTLLTDAKISGSIKVTGSLKMNQRSSVEGSAVVGTLTLGVSSYIAGTVSVTSQTSTITTEVSSSIKNTLTSKSGLVARTDSSVKLFLSGDSLEVDGVKYPLGGKVISLGVNARVGLPPLPPKPKSATSTATVVKNTESTSNVVGTVVNNSNQTNINGSKATANQFNNDLDKTIKTANDLNDMANNIVEQVNSQDYSQINSVADVDNYINTVSDINKEVNDINVTATNIKVNYSVPAYLFGFIPTSLSTEVNVSTDKEVVVDFPWYSFLFRKPANESKIAADISSEIDTVSNTEVASFTNKMQVSILNSVLSSFKGLFGNK